MHCYIHQDSEAIGICKNCFKAICNTCAKVHEFGLSCSDACEKKVEESHQMTERALKIYGIGEGKKRKASGWLFNFALGFGFLLFGTLQTWESGLATGGFLLFMGLIFTGFALYKILIDKDTLRC